jgi:hypothetical protein
MEKTKYEGLQGIGDKDKEIMVTSTWVPISSSNYEGQRSSERWYKRRFGWKLILESTSQSTSHATVEVKQTRL